MLSLKNAISLLALTAVIALAALKSHAQDAPPFARISNVSLSGSGCSSATAAVTLSPDEKDLSILFDNFILEAKSSNVNSSTLRSETSCNVNIDLQIPSGWQMAFVSVDYRGFAALPAGTMGYQRFLYQAPGMQVVSMREADYNGPFNNNYTFSAPQKPSRYAWTPCGLSTFRMSLTAILGVYYLKRGVYPDAMMGLDSQDWSMKQNFHVAWARCSR